VAAISLAAGLLMATPAFAQDQAPVSKATDLAAYTAYPSRVIGMGESVSFPIKLRTETAGQDVDLKVTKLPEGWTATFRGANQIVQAAHVQPNSESSVNLRLEPPADVKPGVYDFTVSVQGDGAQATLPLRLTIKDKLPPRLTWSTDLPTKRGKPTTTFNYTLKLKNEGDEDLDVTLTGQSPSSFLLSYSLNGQDVTDFPLAANQTKNITVKARPLNDVAVGNYDFSVQALGGGAQADIKLAAEVVGQASLKLSTPDGRLSGNAYTGKQTPFKLVVQNTGTAPARSIALSAKQPNGWDVQFDPKQIDEIQAGQQVQVTVNVQPAGKAVAGDYMLTVNAKPMDSSTKSVDFRVTVLTSTLWGVVGIALIAVAVGVVALAVVRFGRR